MVPHLLNCKRVSKEVKDEAAKEPTGKKTTTQATTQRPRTLSHSASWSDGLQPLTNTMSLAPPGPLTIPGPSTSATPSPLPSPALPLMPFFFENPAKRRRTSSVYEDSPIIGSTAQPWTPSRQHEFGEDFCRLLVTTRSAWNFANNPETHLFADKWIPGSVVPDRRTLSGPILDRGAGKVEDKLRLKLKGKMVTFQTDGWKNRAKQSVVDTMVTAGSEVRVGVTVPSNNEC
jgi:hypothetical protein